VFCDESYSASPHDLALFVMTCNCNSQTTQYQKNKIKKDNLKKIIRKKTMQRNTVAIHNVL
jgi:ribosomal protein S3AE